MSHLPLLNQTTPIRSEFADDPDYQELIEEFLEALPARRLELMGLFKEENWSELHRKAHQLKGSAGGYGFPGLTEKAKVLEEVAATAHPEATALALVDVLGYTDCILMV